MSDRERFLQQKAWADSHLNEVNRVIRQLVGKIIDIQPTDPGRDRRYGIDYEVKVVGGSVACRIRRADRYNFRDLTITTHRQSGVTPEVTKILDGSVRWYLYAWASQGRFIDWMFVDLDRVRAMRLIEKSIEQGRTFPDPEGGVFTCIPFEELRDSGALVQYQMSQRRTANRHEEAG